MTKFLWMTHSTYLWGLAAEESYLDLSVWSTPSMLRGFTFSLRKLLKKIIILNYIIISILCYRSAGTQVSEGWWHSLSFSCRFGKDLVLSHLAFNKTRRPDDCWGRAESCVSSLLSFFVTNMCFANHEGWRSECPGPTALLRCVTLFLH